MRKKRDFIYRPAGAVSMLLLTFWFVLAGVWQWVNIQKELPEMVQWYKQDGFSYTKSQLTALAEDGRVGFYINTRLMITEHVLGATEELPVRYADLEYFELSGMELEAGEWPKEAGQAAVSKDWALLHYKYLNITGQTLTVDGTETIICGVFDPEHSIRQRLSDDGRDCVYLPAAGSDFMALESVPYYLYFFKTGGDFSVNQEYLGDILLECTGEKMLPDVALDVEAAAHIFIQNIFLGILLWILLLWGHFLCRTKNVMRYLLPIFAVAMVLWHRWYIPTDYLTRNVFALGDYLGQYTEVQKLRHQYQEAGYFGNLVERYTWISWSIFTLQAAAFVWEILWLVIRKQKAKKQNSR